MNSGKTLNLRLRNQTLERDGAGRLFWRVATHRRQTPASETALLLCDVWDKHWSVSATERIEAMVPRMNRLVKEARARGMQIIHAPSEVVGVYAGTPAWQRVLDAPRIELPPALEHDDPPMPVDASDGGSDMGEAGGPGYPWTRQHPGIEIDQSADGISEDGRQIYFFLRRGGIHNLLIMGVHTNMCILNRTFGIKQMVRWGLNVALVRDLTDAMYNPARPPYVSHAEGTRLVTEYIEKFWCDTLSSACILGR